MKAGPLDREARLVEGVAQLQEQHAAWAQAWESEDLRNWKKALLTAQRIWKRVERSCKIHRDDLTTRVRRLTTRGGQELWNPHHYLLDSFERKPPPSPSRGPSQQPRLPRAGPSQAEKRLFDEMERTYTTMEVNFGALRQIATKKMRRQ